ncbi:hypothetical protein [Ornithinibacillus scapharcae]|uniref:hypothetical protein n=1 Tax=Ornithinibacillus scapharcae TaxID=1147159 RepID=UPI0002E524E9|nr:hypothetical protein [Ornithinibacillus scapharcae]
MIKKYTSSDEEKLSELLKRTQEDTNLVTISKSTSCIASYAAYEHGKMIGFIAAWKSKIHPFCTYFRCTTRNKQIGLAADLMEYMESDMKASDYPLQTSLDSSSALVDNYHNQLTLVRKTYLPTITLANIPYASSLDESERVLSFDTIKGNSHIVKKLATLVKKIYRRNTPSKSDSRTQSFYLAEYDIYGGFNRRRKLPLSK